MIIYESLIDEWYLQTKLCRHLGCANPKCQQCALCQRRRCAGSFKKKYLAPSDVLEAECGAQVYVVVVDAATGALVQYGLEDTYLQLSLVDGKKLEVEGEKEEALEGCQLLTNKAGQALLVHGRSGAYTDDKRVIVPMISGQAMLPDLKVTDSSEALLTGRAPPFRLLARVVQRGGITLPGIAPVLSEPFVVATARVRGAAKVEIPHVDDSVSKLEGLGVQTQKKLEDIAAAAAASNVPNLQLPINKVTKVGQFLALVDMAEKNKPLRETLKHVLRLTKMWDIARDHARKAVQTDVQLRVYHPDGRMDVGLVYKCGSFNVVDINRPVGLLRRRHKNTRPDQELVDIIWLSPEMASWPDAVRRIVPRAASSWWHDGHPGWAFLPLNVSHLPSAGSSGQPDPPMSSFSFTRRQPYPSTKEQGTGSHITSPGKIIIAPGWPTVPMPERADLPISAPEGPSNQAPNSGTANISVGPSPSQGTIPGYWPVSPVMISGKPSTAGSPFEDPSFQQLMNMVSGGSDRGRAPTSTESDGGSKGKRKADASLESWMAMNKSLEYDIDLPSTLAGVESLLATGMYNSGQAKFNIGSLAGGLTSLGPIYPPNQPIGSQNAASIPDNAPAQVPGMTMGQLREQFALLIEKEASSTKDLKAFLAKHGLLPAEKSCIDQELQVKTEQSGLESMKSIENGLPIYDENAMSGTSE